MEDWRADWLSLSELIDSLSRDESDPLGDGLCLNTKAHLAMSRK